MKLSIHSQIRDYEVIFEKTDNFINTLSMHPHAYFAVDDSVWKIYSTTLLKKLPLGQVIIIPIHENKKNLETVQKLYNRLIKSPAKRNLTMVSIGGGILQDVSGFAASTIYRGINWIYIPTTLLAQADSCIGSKTSLNYSRYKNLVGTFYPPAQIHIYSPFLKTLQESDFYSGFGEVIKLHLMGGKQYYDSLVNLTSRILHREEAALIKAIQQSLKIKLSYMEGDEFDIGRRNLLNYGHDFGHAIENTSKFEVPHGQAVIIGMMAANIIARNRGLLDGILEEQIAQKILIPNLLIKPKPNTLDSRAIIKAMKKDKKRTGSNLALIMMNTNFTITRVNDLTSEEVAATLGELKIRSGYQP